MGHHEFTNTEGYERRSNIIDLPLPTPHSSISPWTSAIPVLQGRSRPTQSSTSSNSIQTAGSVRPAARDPFGRRSSPERSELATAERGSRRGPALRTGSPRFELAARRLRLRGDKPPCRHHRLGSPRAGNPPFC